MHLNLSSAGNEVHVIWKDQYGNNGGNNLRYKYDDQDPLAPQDLAVTQSLNNHPFLSWLPNNEPDNNFYKIYRWDSYTGVWQYLNQTSGTSYEDLSLTYCPPKIYCPDERNFSFRVTAVDLASHESVPSNEVVVSLVGGPPPPKIGNSANSGESLEYSLAQNYPNPFNPSTTITYSIKSDGFVNLKVFDMLGTEVANLVNEFQDAGNYSVTFNAANLPSGIYVYKIEASSFTDTKKLILLR